MRFVDHSPTALLFTVAIAACGSPNPALSPEATGDAGDDGPSSADAGFAYDLVQIAPEDGKHLGEPGLAATSDGHVTIAWIHDPSGEPPPSLYTAASSDGGRTFGPHQEPWNTERIADVSLAYDPSGKLWMAALDQGTAIGPPPIYGVVLFSSTDHGATWSKPSNVDARGTQFDDRDWLSIDAKGTFHVVNRVNSGNKPGPYTQTLFYRQSTDGASFTTHQVYATPPAAMEGGLPAGVGATADGKRIVVGMKVDPSPGNDSPFGTGSSCDTGGGVVFVSTDGGATFGPAPIPFAGAGQEVPSYCATQGGPKWAPRVIVAGSDVYAFWVGLAGGAQSHALYLSVMRAGASSFSAAPALRTGPPASYVLPTFAVDASGAAHLFWHELANGQYTPMYARSTDGGATMSAPQAVGFSFPIQPRRARRAGRDARAAARRAATLSP